MWKFYFAGIVSVRSTHLWEGKGPELDPDPDPYLWLMDPDLNNRLNLKNMNYLFQTKMPLKSLYLVVICNLTYFTTLGYTGKICVKNIRKHLCRIWGQFRIRKHLKIGSGSKRKLFRIHNTTTCNSSQLLIQEPPVARSLAGWDRPVYPAGGGGGGRGSADLPPRPHPRLPGQVRQQASLLLRPQEIHPVHTRPAHGGLCQKVGDICTRTVLAI